MKITILLGSPRQKNTFAMAESFRKGAEAASHSVELLHVGRMNIRPCLACQFCKREENKGNCVQKDDMSKVYEAWQNSDMVVFASPIHFWNFTGQMQSMITRLYAMMDCMSPKKFVLLLNSADEDVYEGAIYAYKESISLFGGENVGIFSAQGIKESSLKELESFGNNL